MIIFCDIDGVVAKTMERWLELYNSDYNDNLTIHDIHSWDTHLYVKAECGKKIYNYLRLPNFYDKILPVEGAVAGIKFLQNIGHRIIYVTSTPLETPYVKYYWLERIGLPTEKRNYIETEDKDIFRGDVILDDKYENVTGFHGLGFLFDRAWNREFEHSNRIKTWKEFMKVIGSMS